MLAMLRRLLAVCLTPSVLLLGICVFYWIRSCKIPDAWKIGTPSSVHTVDLWQFRYFDFAASSMGRIFIGRLNLAGYDDWAYRSNFRESFLRDHVNGFQMDPAGKGYHWEIGGLGIFRQYAFVDRSSLGLPHHPDAYHNDPVQGFDVVSVPFWFLALFPEAGLCILWWRCIKSVRTNRRRKQNLCAYCGYDLRASVERCSECGNAIGQTVGDFPTVRWGWCITIILCFGLTWLLWTPVAHWWQRHQFLTAQENCLLYTAPVDQIVFVSVVENKPKDLFRISYDGYENGYDGYARYGSQVGAVRPAPECWAVWFGTWRYNYAIGQFRDSKADHIHHRDVNPLGKFDDRIAPIFLHERITPSGLRRIVAVRHPYLEKWGGSASEEHMVWSIFYYTLTPAVQWTDPKLNYCGRLGLILKAEPDRRGFDLRFFAGQADPNDATHFTLRYDVNGVPGTIDCHLKDSATDPIECHFLPGSPGDPSTQPAEKTR